MGLEALTPLAIATIDMWKIFSQERHKLISSRNQKLDRISFLDFLAIFLCKTAFFQSFLFEIDFSDNNRRKSS